MVYCTQRFVYTNLYAVGVGEGGQQQTSYSSKQLVALVRVVVVVAAAVVAVVVVNAATATHSSPTLRTPSTLLPHRESVHVIGTLQLYATSPHFEAEVHTNCCTGVHTIYCTARWTAQLRTLAIQLCFPIADIP
eukprot:gene3751-8368_t